MEKVDSPNTNTNSEPKEVQSKPIPQTEDTNTLNKPKLNPFEAEYSSTKKKEFKFLIQPLNKASADPEKLATEITSILITTEPIHLTLKFDFKELYPFILFSCINSIERGLGAIAYETTSKSIAAVILAEDLLSSPSEGALKVSDSFKAKRHFITEAVKPLLAQTKEFFTSSSLLNKIKFKIIATNTKFQNLGLMSRMINYLVHEYPLFANSEHFVAISSSITSQTSFMKNGFKMLASVDYSEIEVEESSNSGKDKKLIKPFLDMEDVLTEKNLANSPELKILHLQKKPFNNTFKKESEYVEELEMNHNDYIYHKQILDYEHQKTQYGEAILASNLKARDLITLFEQPCIVVETISSKKGVWILARDIINFKSMDIVFPEFDLIEKLDYTLKKYSLVEIKGCYATVRLEEEGKEVECIQLQMPSSVKEEKLFNDMVGKYKKQEAVDVEVICIMGQKKITRLL
mmetsp:Transcript_27343/g.28440  ORF Transcript_27343/g.28440 Transcript_27343/m.28440 type:complete len:462 (-) Transcript_27343:107-1492(-)